MVMMVRRGIVVELSFVCMFEMVLELDILYLLIATKQALLS